MVETSTCLETTQQETTNFTVRLLSCNGICGLAASIREPAGAIITNRQFLSYTVFNTGGMVCNAVSTLVCFITASREIYVAQGEAAEQDVEQPDQNEVCITEHTMHVCSLVPKDPNPWGGGGGGGVWEQKKMTR